ncbi:MAG TPA: hypothetical protein VHB98_18780, partial [Chloroflexota bacterium]|nr:hypothetical protein [Chloroflexota bacterium]
IVPMTTGYTAGMRAFGDRSIPLDTAMLPAFPIWHPKSNCSSRQKRHGRKMKRTFWRLFLPLTLRVAHGLPKAFASSIPTTHGLRV